MLRNLKAWAESKNQGVLDYTETDEKELKRRITRKQVLLSLYSKHYMSGEGNLLRAAKKVQLEDNPIVLYALEVAKQGRDVANVYKRFCLIKDEKLPVEMEPYVMPLILKNISERIAKAASYIDYKGSSIPGLRFSKLWDEQGFALDKDRDYKIIVKCLTAEQQDMVLSLLPSDIEDIEEEMKIRQNNFTEMKSSILANN